ncbi:MAG: iron export ABC transporter permease subunit FetB, partial [Myxococcota bacterium]
RLQLGLERKLLVAAVRSTAQLSLLAIILTPVFSMARPALVLGLGALMIVLAGFEAARRAGHRYPGVGAVSVGAMGVAALTTTAFAVLIVLQSDPWWTPRYLIPLLGMILGNALTGVSVGLERLLSGMTDRRAALEGRLAAGATWWEAVRPLAAHAIRTGMIPILNTMSVVGLITIPGMMTGQILAGADPGQAARYQLLILFLIAAAVAMGTTAAVLLSARMMFDADHRLRLEQLTRSDG